MAFKEFCDICGTEIKQSIKWIRNIRSNDSNWAVCRSCDNDIQEFIANLKK